MMRFLADENFDNRILRGLLRVKPDLDVVRAQDTEISGAEDPILLEWAAKEERILLTHDVETRVGFAYERVKAGLPVPGVFEIRDTVPIGVAIDELILIIEASNPAEWKDKVSYIPLS
ncbi:MAG: DUF5615 family PIN-like protein [Chloroflexi bacterium]|nr:DUF5615 family PIN-like protein [Chloroflexota bacterium]